jgi:hypothetical protein
VSRRSSVTARQRAAACAASGVTREGGFPAGLVHMHDMRVCHHLPASLAAGEPSLGSRPDGSQAPGTRRCPTAVPGHAAQHTAAVVGWHAGGAPWLSCIYLGRQAFEPCTPALRALQPELLPRSRMRSGPPPAARPRVAPVGTPWGASQLARSACAALAERALRAWHCPVHHPPRRPCTCPPASPPPPRRSRTSTR